MPGDAGPRALSAAVTRRRVVATGAKLAYAAPLVAATMQLSAGGAGAVSGPTFRADSICGEAGAACRGSGGVPDDARCCAPLLCRFDSGVAGDFVCTDPAPVPPVVTCGAAGAACRGSGGSPDDARCCAPLACAWDPGRGDFYCAGAP